MTPSLRSYLAGLDHARRNCVSPYRAAQDAAYHQGSTAIERMRGSR